MFETNVHGISGTLFFKFMPEYSLPQKTIAWMQIHEEILFLSLCSCHFKTIKNKYSNINTNY